ncbi:MAG TPA: 2-amino-3,7-dideoxy-D-threo-hept-6-ulosonate synthase [Jatrophihabitans sp.]|nr:2-amino-3,7-dideoxy-D-threo-hept-6-ulosonate synthase [Jatrophihabitans sp.]
MNLGKQRRLNRLCRSGDGRYFFVPMDHSVSDGPPELCTRFAQVGLAAAQAGADALIMHKGRMAALAADPGVRGCGLIVHLSASTVHGPDPDAKVLVGCVREAVRLGADAVSVHVNVGSRSEPEQLRGLGEVADQCEEFGMPLLAMVYLRGPQVLDSYDATELAHVVNIAIDLGADLVKTSMPRPLNQLSQLVDSACGRLILSGGPAADDSLEFLGIAEYAIRAGVAGLAIGRRVWTAAEPAAVVRELAQLIHPGSPVVAAVG